VVRGSSKMARGAVHPSDVLRAIMVDLEAIGIDSKGAETDRKLAETQMSSILCSNPFLDSSKRKSSEILIEGSESGEVPTTSMSIAVSTVSAEIDEKSFTAVEHTVTEDSVLGGAMGTSEVQNESRMIACEGAVGGESNHAMDVTDIQGTATCDSSVIRNAFSADTSSEAATLTSTIPLESNSLSPHTDVLSADTITPFIALSTTPLVSSSSSTPLPSATITAILPPAEHCSPPSHSRNTPKKSLAETLTELSDEHSISRSASAVSSTCLLLSCHFRYFREISLLFSSVRFASNHSLNSTMLYSMTNTCL
jgi:hypothetical protein